MRINKFNKSTPLYLKLERRIIRNAATLFSNMYSTKETFSSVAIHYERYTQNLRPISKFGREL